MAKKKKITSTLKSIGKKKIKKIGIPKAWSKRMTIKLQGAGQAPKYS